MLLGANVLTSVEMFVQICDTPIYSIYDYTYSTSPLRAYCHTHLRISFLCHLPPRPIHHGFYPPWHVAQWTRQYGLPLSICCFLSHWLLPSMYRTFWSYYLATLCKKTVTTDPIEMSPTLWNRDGQWLLQLVILERSWIRNSAQIPVINIDVKQWGKATEKEE